MIIIYDRIKNKLKIDKCNGNQANKIKKKTILSRHQHNNDEVQI